MKFWTLWEFRAKHTILGLRKGPAARLHLKVKVYISNLLNVYNLYTPHGLNEIILFRFLCFWGFLCTPWDYPENFRICSQLDWKMKTFFFFYFAQLYIFLIKPDKILISQLSTPKFKCFSDQNGPKAGPHENEFWQFSNGKMSSLNS